MDQVPAIMQMRSGATTPEPMAQASMSNMPPVTGVPGSSPVSLAASSVTTPHTSVARQSGGSAPATSGMP